MREAGRPEADRLREIGRSLTMPDRRKLAHALVAAALFGAAACPAQARTLRIDGTSGYLSEWEVKAEVTSAPVRRPRGILRTVHVAACRPVQPEWRGREGRARSSSTSRNRCGRPMPSTPRSRSMVRSARTTGSCPGAPADSWIAVTARRSPCAVGAVAAQSLQPQAWSCAGFRERRLRALAKARFGGDSGDICDHFVCCATMGGSGRFR